MCQFQANAFIRGLACTVLLAISVSAQAQLRMACSQQNSCFASRALTPGVEATLMLEWRGQVAAKRGSAPASQGGAFIVGSGSAGRVLASNTSLLRSTVSPSADGREQSFRVRESLRVPAEVSQQAAALGFKQFYYQREFIMDGVTVSVIQTITLKRPLAGAHKSVAENRESGSNALGVSRVSLRFDSGAQVASIARNQKLSAIATINYQRAGSLDGVWELATPASTGGQAVYRRLENVHQSLVGDGQALVQSPQLPSDELGVYSLRFRLLLPGEPVQPIVLRYQVGAQGLDEKTKPAHLSVDGPEVNAILSTTTAFSWQTQPSTETYQLAFYRYRPASVDEVPATGLMLPPGQTQTVLSPSVFSYLPPRSTVYWRVIAFNAEGIIIAVSPLREIRTQK